MLLLEDMIAKLESHPQCGRWAMYSFAYHNGKPVGEGMMTLIVHSPLCSGGGPKWVVYFHRHVPWNTLVEYVFQTFEQYPNGMSPKAWVALTE